MQIYRYISQLNKRILKNISTQKERIVQYLDYKGISKNKFYIATGISNGTLDKKSGITGDTIEKFYSIYNDINIEWLITGEGNMLKETSNTKEVQVLSKDELEHLDKETKVIPLVSPLAAAGFGTPDFAITQEDIKEHYVIPKFKYLSIDFMIEISGLSMYPSFNSGDIVACTVLKERKFIQWNKPHLIGTKEQGLLVKRLKRSDNPEYIIAVSDNPEYEPIEIPISEITGLALVVGVIRIE